MSLPSNLDFDYHQPQHMGCCSLKMDVVMRFELHVWPLGNRPPSLGSPLLGPDVDKLALELYEKASHSGEGHSLHGATCCAAS